MNAPDPKLPKPVYGRVVQTVQWRSALDTEFGTVRWMDGEIFTIVPHSKFGFGIYGPLMNGIRYFGSREDAKLHANSVVFGHLKRVHDFLTENAVFRPLSSDRERVEGEIRATRMAIFYGVCIAIAFTVGLYGLFSYLHNHF